MGSRFRFEKLEVWQEARSLNRAIYGFTREFPKDEMFGLTSQLRRAAVSVAANIAEGSGRNSDRDFAHFLEQAYGSLMETASLLYLARDQHYGSEVNLGAIWDRLELLARRIASLNRSLAVRNSKTPFVRSLSRLTLDPRPSTLD